MLRTTALRRECAWRYRSVPDVDERFENRTGTPLKVVARDRAIFERGVGVYAETNHRYPDRGRTLCVSHPRAPNRGPSDGISSVVTFARLALGARRAGAALTQS